MTETSALEVFNVAVCYGKFTAVESASFSLAQGELVAIVGPNGHGKSSLLGAVAGLVSRQGSVSTFGEVLPPGNPRSAVRAGVILVPEGRHLYPGLSVRDNILLGSYDNSQTIWTSRAWQKASSVLDLFPELLSHLAKPAGTLSGGQQQMVALARALAGHPKVLLLDEPCLGLAEAMSARVYESLAALNREGMTVLLVEENPVRALEICQREIRMYRGTITDEAFDPTSEDAALSPSVKLLDAEESQ